LTPKLEILLSDVRRLSSLLLFKTPSSIENSKTSQTYYFFVGWNPKFSGSMNKFLAFLHETLTKMLEFFWSASNFSRIFEMFRGI
jgi:hypothetical protein